MATKMTERDWEPPVEGLRACLPRRGAKGRDDRLFLEALHCFAVRDITSRALPERFGHGNAVWKRFSRLGEAGMFDGCFAMLAECSRTAHVAPMFDRAVVRARLGRRNRQFRGARKIRRALRREGLDVARRTVERLMQAMGIRGVVRGRKIVTTNPDAARPCPDDKVNRLFKADRPNRRWVSDFTYVPARSGTVYVAFVIDVFALKVVGGASPPRCRRSSSSTPRARRSSRENS